MEARVVSLQGLLRQTWCGNVDIGLQSPKCDLQEALLYVLCQVDVLFFHMFLCVHQVFIQFAHIIDLIEECASTWCMCAIVYVRVWKGVFCVLFILSTVLRHISTVSHGLVNCRALKCI